MDLTSKHHRILRIALKHAAKVPYNHKHCAILVRGGKILSVGVNNYDNGFHAEMSAIGKRWLNTLSGATLYIIRIRKEQAYGLSRPCPKCEKLIREAKIRDVVYTTNNPEAPLAYEQYT